MKSFKYYLLNKYRKNNPDFRFNTFGSGYLTSTFFYLKEDGIYSEMNYKKITGSDQRKVLEYLYKNRDKILHIYTDEIISEQLKENLYFINGIMIEESTHLKAIRKYIRLTRSRILTSVR